MQQNRTDETAVKYATGIIVKKFQTFNIRVNDIVLYCFINLSLNLRVLTLIYTRN